MESSNLPILIFAGLLGAWFGAALFYVVIVGPAAVQAGSSGVVEVTRGFAGPQGNGRFRWHALAARGSRATCLLPAGVRSSGLRRISARAGGSGARAERG
jgi:hypothetical protein